MNELESAQQTQFLFPCLSTASRLLLEQKSFVVFLRGIYHSSKWTVHRTFVQHLSHESKMKCDGRDSLSSSFFFPFRFTPISRGTVTLQRQCTLLMLPTFRGTLTLWQYSITLRVFSMLPDSPTSENQLQCLASDTGAAPASFHCSPLMLAGASYN